MGFLWFKGKETESEFVDMPTRLSIKIEPKEVKPMPLQQTIVSIGAAKPAVKMPQDLKPEAQKRITFKCYKCGYSFKRGEDFHFAQCPYCGKQIG